MVFENIVWIGLWCGECTNILNNMFLLLYTVYSSINHIFNLKLFILTVLIYNAHSIFVISDVCICHARVHTGHGFRRNGGSNAAAVKLPPSVVDEYGVWLAHFLQSLASVVLFYTSDTHGANSEKKLLLTVHDMDLLYFCCMIHEMW